MKPKLSILCIAYNQVKFIRDCLDGFVMQKTNFPFEVIIHDDASTDGTADIIREYAEKYPDIIKPIFQTENQFSKGVKIGKTYTWPLIRGKYVAMCEGDDYWTDPNKLQRQVDFLDAHPDYSVCFHPVRVTWDDKSKPDSVFPTKRYRFNKTTLELSDLLKHNFIQTNSVVYRWRTECSDLFPNGILPGDWYMHLLHAQVGKIGFIPDVMAVYRRNAGGIWTGAMQTDLWFTKCTLPCLKFYSCAMEQFNYDYTTDMANVASGGICAFLRASMFDRIEYIHDTYPEIWEKATRNINAKDNKSIQRHAKKYKHLFNTVLVVAIIEFILICVLGVVL